ncbi:MAG: hypothetical protein WCA35_26050 [Kovacikia sp.]
MPGLAQEAILYAKVDETLTQLQLPPVFALNDLFTVTCADIPNSGR